MNKKIAIIVIAVLVVGGVAYGLSKNNNKDTSTTDSNTSQNNSPTPPPSSDNSTGSDTSGGSNNPPSGSQSTNSVSINNFAFSPKDITVKKGTTVTWTNNDSVTHTVQETDGKSGPKSDNLATGATYTYTFIAAGTYAYHCSIHPDMTGTVTVTE